MRSDKPGKKLEALVANLERVLHKTAATIEVRSRRLIDRDTGKRREHDVLITWDHGHHQIITAIECRDRSRPVGVPAVEAFADKCDATGVQHGVIVSATGFTKTARTKAQVRGITCMELADVDDFEWLGTDKFAGYMRKITEIRFTIRKPLSRESFEGVVYSPSGRKVTVEQLAKFVVSQFPLGLASEEHVRTASKIRIPIVTKGWTVRGKDGEMHAFDRIEAEVVSEVIKTESPITQHRYIGGGKDYSFASADSPMASMPGQILMVQNEDRSTSIFFVPEKPTDA